MTVFGPFLQSTRAWPAGRRRAYSTLLLMRLAVFQQSWNLSDVVTNAEVGSYPAFSPLSDRLNGKTVYFLWRYLSPFPGARALPGIMPCGARTFLPTVWSGGSLVHHLSKCISFLGCFQAKFISFYKIHW